MTSSTFRFTTSTLAFGPPARSSINPLPEPAANNSHAPEGRPAISNAPLASTVCPSMPIAFGSAGSLMAAIFTEYAERLPTTLPRTWNTAVFRRRTFNSGICWPASASRPIAEAGSRNSGIVRRDVALLRLIGRFASASRGREVEIPAAWLSINRYTLIRSGLLAYACSVFTKHARPFSISRSVLHGTDRYNGIGRRPRFINAFRLRTSQRQHLHL